MALNCVANGKVLRDGNFDNIWIQPAAGDAGGAFGAALAAYHLHFRDSRARSPVGDGMSGAFSGPSFAQAEIERRLTDGRRALHQCSSEDAMIEHHGARRWRSKAVGWFQGRMEFGPRALGARSILGDPRSPPCRRISI